MMLRFEWHFCAKIISKIPNLLWKMSNYNYKVLRINIIRETIADTDTPLWIYG